MTPERAAAWEKEKQKRARHNEKVGRRLGRLVGDAIDGWRTCSVRECQRKRACSSDTFACIAKNRRENTRVLTPEERAQSISDFRKMVEEEMARRRAQAQWEETAEEAKPARRAGRIKRAR